MDNQNIICRQLVKDTKRELRGYFKTLQKKYDIWNTSLEFVTDIHELLIRIENIKKLNDKLLTKEAIIDTIDYLAKVHSFMRTQPIPYLDENNKFKFKTSVIVPTRSVEKTLIDCSTDIQFALEYLLFILTHEFGHVIVGTKSYSKCTNLVQFVRLRNIEIETHKREMEMFDRDAEDWFFHYHNDISTERLADQAVGITAEQAYQMNKRYTELSGIVLPNQLSWKYKEGDDNHGT